jgi:Fur family transcriptional regulator, ferric uptake regulator
MTAKGSKPNNAVNSGTILERANEIFDAHLGMNKLRRTPERFAILKEVYECNHHFDIESLYKSMKSKKYRVSRATLYNTIDLLLECDLVRKHRFGEQQARYEKSLHHKQHDHIIRTDTGEVIEFCDPRIQSIKATLEEIFDLDISHHSLYFYATPKDKKTENV